MDEVVELEKNRIKLFFKKNNYSLEKKKYYLQAKEMEANAVNNITLLRICSELKKELGLSND